MLENPNIVDITASSYWSKLSLSERFDLRKVSERHRIKTETPNKSNKQLRFESMRIFIECLKSNSKSLRVLKICDPQLTWRKLFEKFLNDNFRWSGEDGFLNYNKTEKLRAFGNYISSSAQNFIMRKHNDIESNLDGNTLFHTRLPLYACSGELEFCSINRSKEVVLSSKTTSFWNVGYDGGGQHEVRFLINKRLPDYACSLVGRLGGVARNGGHIHINCRKDEVVAIRVYNALRYHLSWFRWLEPKSRRESRFARVSSTSRTFRQSQGNKYASVTASPFNHYGTVEVRIWGATADPEVWRGRAALMQAIAKWSETNESLNPATNEHHPIIVSTGLEAFTRLSEWMHANDMNTLKWVIQSIRKRSRQRAKDPTASALCETLLNQFINSGLKIPGVRLPAPTTATTTSLHI
jgi:hypothetical protein